MVSVGRGAEGFDTTPDGKQIWAANAQDGTISVIDAAEKKVVDTLNANVRSANRLKFTAPSACIWIPAAPRPIFKRFTWRRVLASNVETNTRACTPDDYVAIIDLKSLEVAGHIEAGKLRRRFTFVLAIYSNRSSEPRLQAAPCRCRSAGLRGYASAAPRIALR